MRNIVSQEGKPGGRFVRKRANPVKLLELDLLKMPGNAGEVRLQPGTALRFLPQEKGIDEDKG